jgi:hypothetical protein
VVVDADNTDVGDMARSSYASDPLDWMRGN